MDNQFTLVPAPISSYRSSEQNDKIWKPFLKAVNSIEAAKKDSQNPHFKSHYADLSSCMDAIKPSLVENGIALVQFPYYDVDAKVVRVTTRVFDENGQYVEWDLHMPVVATKPQEVGSAITYCRRYALAGVGLISEEDDDGNSSSGREGSRQQRQPQQQAQQPTQAKKDPPRPQAVNETKTTAAKASPNPDWSPEVEAEITEILRGHDMLDKTKPAMDWFRTHVFAPGVSPDARKDFLALAKTCKDFTILQRKAQMAAHKPSFAQAIGEAKALGSIEKWIDKHTPINTKVA